MWAHLVGATGEAGTDEPALWENDTVKTLQLSPLNCTGKLANSGHWVISHEMLAANPLLKSSSSINAVPLLSY